MALSTIGINGTSGFGKIGQVVQGTILSAEFNTTSSSFVDTGVSVSITPSATSSKILVSVTCSALAIATTSTNGRNIGKIYRDSTAIGTDGFELAKIRQDGSYNQEVGTAATIQLLDTPSTTSAISYKLYIQKEAGDAVRIADAGYDAVMQAIEVLA
mgnify:CR=1 FL=1|jgi:hypothetical protein|tara:strand:+ start:26 stop:496 length:471 start_codon:yes stop_codon:yes gene_type:complete